MDVEEPARRRTAETRVASSLVDPPEVIKAPRVEAFKQVDNAFFVGVAPINDPDYVVSVVVERGGSGGRVAAPVARQVLQYLLNGPAGVTELAPGLDAD